MTIPIYKIVRAYELIGVTDMSMSEVARALNVNRLNLTNAIRRVEQKGLDFETRRIRRKKESIYDGRANAINPGREGPELHDTPSPVLPE